MSATTPAAPFVHAILLREGGDDYSGALPALQGLERLELDPRVTFLVGENGSGKSTLIEALAVAAKLNVEGGGKLLKFSTRKTHSQLHERLTLERSKLPPLNAFFLRPKASSISRLQSRRARTAFAGSTGAGGADALVPRGPRALLTASPLNDCNLV